MGIRVFSMKNPKKHSASLLRVAGYTRHNKQTTIYSCFDLPKKMSLSNSFVKFSYPRKLWLMLLLYCAFPVLLRFLRFKIEKYDIIRDCKQTSDIMIFHQDFKIGFFLAREYGKKCIFDIHGILDLQRENSEGLPMKEKVVFGLQLRGERNYFTYPNYYNAVSPQMKSYLMRKYHIKSERIFIARDGTGLPDKKNVRKELFESLKKKLNVKKYKVILFVGSFWSFGGVYDLVRAFHKVCSQRNDVKLLLVGQGQEEHSVSSFISQKNLSSRVFHVSRIPYDQMPTYQKVADVIVCPDRVSAYSDITPHIKIFDSLFSSKPMVASWFACLDFIKREFKGVLFFRPGNVDDLADKLLLVLKSQSKYSKAAMKNNEHIEKYTFQEASLEYYGGLSSHKF